MGRPTIGINEKIIEGMAVVGATDVEIAHFVGCSESTIRSRRFRGILTKARAEMRTRLRQAQFRLALNGNATMLIWLGKQMLDQKDRADEPTRGVDATDTARQVRDAVRAMREADGLSAA